MARAGEVRDAAERFELLDHGPRVAELPAHQQRLAVPNLRRGQVTVEFCQLGSAPEQRGPGHEAGIIAKVVGRERRHGGGSISDRDGHGGEAGERESGGGWLLELPSGAQGVAVVLLRIVVGALELVGLGESEERKQCPLSVAQ